MSSLKYSRESKLILQFLLLWTECHTGVYCWCFWTWQWTSQFHKHFWRFLAARM